MRFLALLIALAGCQGKGGAVSVRWRLRDSTTGAQYNPRDVNVGGACQHKDSCGNIDWNIDTVDLVVAKPAIGNEPAKPIDQVPFPCSQREGTTAFNLPLGTFSFSLQPQPAGSAASPAAQVRTTLEGQIVNLDIVEIAVNPLPLIDAGWPDCGNS